MKTLVIRAQDIASIEVAQVVDGAIAHVAAANAQPEGYLQEVDRLMREWKADLDAIDAVAVVTGPGSFTAARVSVTIANAIAFAKKIPVVGIENKKRLPLEELLTTADFHTLPAANHFVPPIYDRPPHITIASPS